MEPVSAFLRGQVQTPPKTSLQTRLQQIVSLLLRTRRSHEQPSCCDGSQSACSWETIRPAGSPDHETKVHLASDSCWLSNSVSTCVCVCFSHYSRAPVPPVFSGTPTADCGATPDGGPAFEVQRCFNAPSCS